MTIASDFLDYIIIPTLRFLEPEIKYTDTAAALLLGTAAQESHLGNWVDQTTPGPGPAFGPFQMEEATHDDIWDNFLRYRLSLRVKVASLEVPAIVTRKVEEMHGNWYYAAAMARVHYFRNPFVMSPEFTVNGLALIWKTYYNTILGKGTCDEFVANWGKHGCDKLFPVAV